MKKQYTELLLIIGAYVQSTLLTGLKRRCNALTFIRTFWTILKSILRLYVHMYFFWAVNWTSSRIHLKLRNKHTWTPLSVCGHIIVAYLEVSKIFIYGRRHVLIEWTHFGVGMEICKLVWFVYQETSDDKPYGLISFVRTITTTY